MALITRACTEAHKAFLHRNIYRKWSDREPLPPILVHLQEQRREVLNLIEDQRTSSFGAGFRIRLR